LGSGRVTRRVQVRDGGLERAGLAQCNASGCRPAGWLPYPSPQAAGGAERPPDVRVGVSGEGGGPSPSAGAERAADVAGDGAADIKTGSESESQLVPAYLGVIRDVATAAAAAGSGHVPAAAVAAAGSGPPWGGGAAIASEPGGASRQGPGLPARAYSARPTAGADALSESGDPPPQLRSDAGPAPSLPSDPPLRSRWQGASGARRLQRSRQRELPPESGWSLLLLTAAVASAAAVLARRAGARAARRAQVLAKGMLAAAAPAATASS
jgi:hypothetical protein